MKRSFPLSHSQIALLGLLATSVLAQDNVVRKPLTIGTKMETGQIVKGESVKSGEDPDLSLISRTAVALSQEVTVDNRLDIKVGVGGVFYSVFPDVRSQYGSQGIKFGPGITQAQAAYRLGANPEKPVAILRAGYFPYKYNPDARNLGEYLLRSMAYPAFTFTGGWSITDNAMVRAQGLQATVFQLDGSLKHDFLLTLERDFRPTGNITPSYLVEYTSGPVQVGAGASFFHFLPLDSKRLKSKDMGPLSVYRYNDVDSFYTATDYINGDTLSDGPYIHKSGTDFYISAIEEQGFRQETELAAYFADPSTTRDTIEYDTKAIKLMVRGSFNIQKIIPLSFLNPNDLKVYAEAALLGVKNQPVFFEKRSERIPVMVGVNLPTFKVLDFLTVEVEYFGSPLPDDYDQVLQQNFPVYDGYYAMLHKSENNREDDWKWSVYASKKLTTGFSVAAQIANDHLRAIDQATTNFSGKSVMRDPSNWYYVITLNFGI